MLHAAVRPPQGFSRTSRGEYLLRVRSFRRIAVFVAAVAAVAFLLTCATGPQGVQFKAQLSAAKDAQSRATGEADFQLSADGTSLSYTLSVSNLMNVTMAHIHVASAPGQSGDVAAWLYPAKAPPVLKEGSFTGVLGQGTITAASLQGPLANATVADLLDRIKRGLAYVNVHTNQYPGGEIQGTIGPATMGSGSGQTGKSY